MKLRLTLLVFPALMALPSILATQPETDKGVINAPYTASPVQPVERIWSFPGFPADSLTTGAREVRVSLPEGYYESKERYPVIYVHDGEGAFSGFDKTDSGMDLNGIRDKLVSSREIRPAILVALLNANPTSREKDLVIKWGKREGGLPAYADWIRTSVKPFVDARFRTLPGREDTGVVGFSLGGFAAFWMAWNQPDVYGFAGCFAPSMWLENESLTATVAAAKPIPVRFWIDSGDTQDNLLPSLHLARALVKAGWTEGDDLLFHIGYGQTHAVAACRQRAPEMLAFLLGPQNKGWSGYRIQAVNSEISRQRIDLASAGIEAVIVGHLEDNSGRHYNPCLPALTVADATVARLDEKEPGLLRAVGPGRTTVETLWNGQKSTLEVLGTSPFPTYPCPEVTPGAAMLTEAYGMQTLVDSVGGVRIDFLVVHSADAIHFSARVKDATLVADAAKFPWEQDGIELRIDPRPADESTLCRGGGENEPGGFLLLGFSPTEDAKKALLVPGEKDKEMLPKGLTWECSRCDSGWNVEVTLPDAWLDGMQGGRWESFRMNLILNNTSKDSEKPTKLEWYPDWRSAGNRVGSGLFVRQKPIGQTGK
ncbi:MAG: alpha/beta hydrolase-fold protein [Verrucomicrobiota bacterium]|nr:alpha/beta hydrolase-fold protein [Verrucomicrobiota bacterium]